METLIINIGLRQMILTDLQKRYFGDIFVSFVCAHRMSKDFYHISRPSQVMFLGIRRYHIQFPCYERSLMRSGSNSVNIVNIRIHDNAIYVHGSYRFLIKTYKAKYLQLSHTMCFIATRYTHSKLSFFESSKMFLFQNHTFLKYK